MFETLSDSFKSFTTAWESSDVDGLLIFQVGCEGFLQGLMLIEQGA